MESNEGSSAGGVQSTGAGAATMSNPSVNNSSTNIEVNVGKGNNGFSSKGFSMFKDIGKFNAEKPMIDISKPVFEEKIVPHENVEPKPEFSQNPIIDINHGNESKPFFNKPESFNVKPSFIDISRPFVETPKEKHSNVLQNKAQESKQTELKANTAFHFTQTFHPEVKHETQQAPEPVKSQEFHNEENIEDEQETHLTTEVKAEFKPEHEDVKSITEKEFHAKGEFKIRDEIKTSEKTEPQPQVEIKKGHASSVGTDTNEENSLHEMVSVRSETHSSVSTEVQEKVEDAEQYILPQLQKMEGSSVAKVRQAIAVEIARQNPEEVELSQDLDEKVRLGKTDKTFDTKAKELFEKRQLEKEGYIKPAPDEMGLLYLQKDKDTNTFREMMMLMRAEKEILHSGGVEGQSLANAIQRELPDSESEIVRGVHHDGSLDVVAEQVSRLGRFTNMIDVKRNIRSIIERATAVKLSKEAKEHASKEDAERVYKRELDGVSANLKEENSRGVLLQTGRRQTVYVSGQRKIGEPLEDEVHNSAA